MGLFDKFMDVMRLNSDDDDDDFYDDFDDVFFDVEVDEVEAPAREAAADVTADAE